MTEEKIREEAFFISAEGKIAIIAPDVLDQLSREEAIMVAMSAYLAQKSQLLNDTFQGDRYIDDIKVVDGLEASLSRLEENYPNILNSVKKKISGTVFAQC